MRLPLELLQTFIAVAETLSFTRAGQRVNRTQSAVSMQIKRLEHELGRELFRRERRSVSLTEEGRLLLPYAREMVRLEGRAMAALAKPEMRGEVSLGMPEDYATSLLPGVLAKFAKSHPRVRVHVFSDLSRRLALSVRRGELDLTVCNSGDGTGEALGDGDEDREITGEIVHREPVVWACSERHETYARESLPLAVYHQGCPFRRWAEQALERMGRRYHIAYTSPGVGGILGAVREGLSVAPVARTSLGSGLVEVGTAQGLPLLPFSTVTLHRGGSGKQPLVDALADHIIAAFAGC
jgi:DNA-binding transcriptional LysR family regulator